MTNPFAIIVLHGIETYNKIVTSSPTRYEFPKGLFALSGTTAATAATATAHSKGADAAKTETRGVA